MATLTPEQKKKIREGLEAVNRKIKEAKELAKAGQLDRAQVLLGEIIRKKMDTLKDFPHAHGKNIFLEEYYGWYIFWEGLFDLLINIITMIFTGRTYRVPTGPSCSTVLVDLKKLLEWLEDRITLLEFKFKKTTDPKEKKALKKIIDALKRLKNFLISFMKPKKSIGGIFGTFIRMWERIKLLYLLWLIFSRIRFGLYVKYAKEVWGDFLTQIIEIYIIIDDYLGRCGVILGKHPRDENAAKQVVELLDSAEKKKKELEVSLKE